MGGSRKDSVLSLRIRSAWWLADVPEWCNRARANCQLPPISQGNPDEALVRLTTRATLSDRAGRGEAVHSHFPTTPIAITFAKAKCPVPHNY